MRPTVPGIDELAKRLRAARGYSGLSQEALATQVGVSLATLKRLESGQRSLRKFERRAFIAAVADATGLPVPWFTLDFASLEAPELQSGAVPADPEWFEAKVQEALTALQAAYGPRPEEYSPAAQHAPLAHSPVGLEDDEASAGGTASDDENALAQPLEELTAADTDQPRRSARTRHGPPTNRQAG